MDTAEAPHITKEYTPTQHLHAILFLSYTTAGERDKHILSPVLDTLDKGWSPLPDMTVEEMYLFLAIIVEKGQPEDITG